MTDQRMRFVELQRGQIDMDSGEFPMVLATDGEASDGDILSIEGAQFADRSPLQLSHVNDPRSTLGTVSHFRRDLQSNPRKLRAKGQIELGGEGPTAEIRRDVAYMIGQGHVTGISVSWEPIRWQRRMELPKEHPAHVGENEKDFRKRNGFYHEKWRVLEGSVVSIQADKAALIGRAEETEGAVAEFWRTLAEHVEPESVPEPEPEPVVEEPTDESRLAAFGAQIRELTDQYHLNLDQLSEVLESQRPPKAPSLAEALTTISALEARLAALEERRDNGQPSRPLLSVQDIYSELQTKVTQATEDIPQAVRALIDSRLGKPNPAHSVRQAMHAKVETAFREAKENPGTPEIARLGELVTHLEQLVKGAKERDEQEKTI